MKYSPETISDVNKGPEKLFEGKESERRSLGDLSSSSSPPPPRHPSPCHPAVPLSSSCLPAHTEKHTEHSITSPQLIHVSTWPMWPMPVLYSSWRCACATAISHLLNLWGSLRWRMIDLTFRSTGSLFSHTLSWFTGPSLSVVLYFAILWQCGLLGGGARICF